MLDLLGALGVIAYALVSVVVGVRLLALGRRTRGLPELTLGAGFLSGVVLGYVPETVVLSTDLFSPGVEWAVLACTQVAIRGAALSILFFTWRVFRPGERWAAALAWGVAALLVVSWLAFPGTRSQTESAADLFWYEIYAVTRTACLFWGALEAGRYFLASRRRMRLGLADPLLTDRFRLWSVGLAAAGILMGSTLWAAWVGVDPAVTPWVLAESFVGLVSAIAIWLTFFPPRAYRRRVTSHAGKLDVQNA